MIWAATCLALALLIGGRPAGARLAVASNPARARPVPADPLAVASSLELFSACLSAGMPVAAAARATAASAPAAVAGALRRAAELLTLGADPVTAWTPPDGPVDAGVEALCRLARRSAVSGAALAHGAADLADQSRGAVADTAAAAGERAAVLIAGPLGVCFLPAFVCLGIVPVIAGLAGDVLVAW